MAASSRLYNSRVQKGGALIPEVRALLRVWDPEADTDELVEELTRRNFLGKSTRARMRDVLRRTFVPRYVNGMPSDAWRSLQPLERAGFPPDQMLSLLYYHAARSERLIYDFASEVVYDIYRAGLSEVPVQQALDFIARAVRDGRIDPAWSASVSLKVARGVLAALRDFGILEGRARKCIRPPSLAVPAFAYIAFCVKHQAASGQGTLCHRDWRLLLLDRGDVERLLVAAHQQDLLWYQAAGSVVRIDFPTDNLVEYAHALAERANPTH